MAESGVVLGLVGSPNREGRTNELVTAALEGAAKAGAPTEIVQMADHVVSACRDCLPWVCQTNLKCTYDDPAFEYLSEKVLNCGALVLGTPIYWWDTSAMVKYFVLKMFRVYARSAPLHGLPAGGIGIAGGTGNGLISGLRPVYHFFQMMQMRALPPYPSTRFNYNTAMGRARQLGTRLGEMAQKRHPFAGLEERLLWYDNVTYLDMSRASERRLLAGLTTAAVSETADPAIAEGLSRADSLAAMGRPFEALTEATRVYEAGVKAFEGR